MEQGTGYLRAIVGSRDEPTIKRSLNRAYQSRMAVGSSIKPIAVYGPALDKGDGLGTVVPYIPAEIDGWISSAGYPTSDSRRPYGPVTIRRGIVSSLNIVAARVLMSDVGLEDSYSYLLKLGIKTPQQNRRRSGSWFKRNNCNRNERGICRSCKRRNVYRTYKFYARYR